MTTINGMALEVLARLLNALNDDPEIRERVVLGWSPIEVQIDGCVSPLALTKDGDGFFVFEERLS